jgi:hypothetical protein
MKAIKIKLAMLLLGLTLSAAVPVLAQSSKDTSTSTTKANGAGRETDQAREHPVLQLYPVQEQVLYRTAIKPAYPAVTRA